ncbi:hypothetical protein AB0E77_20530 [Streptomyces sp. NPDC032940]|uniref:hypothetical protein n=1 Tax=Streptomyces sp. NPDC032940 TaxID=3155366 RepID=UPI0033F9E21A
MPDRTRTVERYARGAVAAVAAVAALVLAANAGPTQSEERPSESGIGLVEDGGGRAEDAGGSLASAVRPEESTPAAQPGSR